MDPYTGITDFTDCFQVMRMLDIFNQHKKSGSKRMFHVGVMMSYKTLHGLETKWAKVFPKKETVAGIFVSDEAYNCLHYADYDHSRDFSSDLARAIKYGGMGIHAVQLDMVWPDPFEIRSALRRARKKIEVILQLSKNAIEAVGGTPDGVVERLHKYNDAVDRVLLDYSMGRGHGMDAERLIPFALAIRDKFPHLGIGAAGGLGPHTMDLVLPLLEAVPNLSIDAQGQLRSSGNALDLVEWERAKEYLIRASEILE